MRMKLYHTRCTSKMGRNLDINLSKRVKSLYSGKKKEGRKEKIEDAK